MKAERKFEEWKEKKEMMEREKKEQELQKKRDIELAEKCKKIKAQQKYEEWLRSAKDRPKSSQSFGYSGGKLTGGFRIHTLVYFRNMRHGRGWGKFFKQRGQDLLLLISSVRFISLSFSPFQ